MFRLPLAIRVCAVLALMTAFANLLPLHIARAAVCTVTNTVTNNADSGIGSLRDAITFANANSCGSTIDFAITGSPPVLIIVLGSALPQITSAVLIDGDTQPGLIIDGASSFRPLDIAVGGVTLRGLTFQNGFDASRNGGGAVYAELPAGAVLTIAHCLFLHNTAQYYGGALFNTAGTVQIDDSTFSNNTASNSGGAIHDDSGIVNLNRSTLFSNNTMQGEGGAGIYYNDIPGGQIATISNSTIEGNQAAAGYGGGVNSAVPKRDGTLNIISSTITNNSIVGGGAGGGIAHEADGVINLQQTIAAYNYNYNKINNTSTPDDLDGPFISADYNLIQSPGLAVIVLQPHDILHGDPILGSLAANGGYTNTRALLAGSPAIGAVLICASPIDQRKIMRPATNCDMGAYEYTELATNTPPPTVTITTSPTPTASVTNNPTFTPSASATGSPTATFTLTASATNTPSSTPTFTPSASATGSPTATFTLTASATNTPSSTPTFTPSASATGSPTATFTLTASATNTASITPTFTPSASATGSPTATFTLTASATNTPSSTPTFTPSASATGSPTATFTLTASATASLTATFTSSASATNTPTGSNTVTMFPAKTLTPLQASSATNVPTATLTVSAVNSATAQRSPTLTTTQTATQINTQMVTQTATQTAVQSTAIQSGTPLVTATSTSSPTVTPTGVSSTNVPPTTQNTRAADPVLSMAADPQLAEPGEIVTFTITIINHGDMPATNVIVSDPLESALQIGSAAASQGIFTINGQSVLFTVGSINPAQTVTLKVLTHVRGNVVPPMDVINTVRLDYVQGSRRIMSVTIHITRGNLPATGEHPYDAPDVLLPLVVGGLLVSLLGVRRYQYRSIDRR